MRPCVYGWVGGCASSHACLSLPQLLFRCCCCVWIYGASTLQDEASGSQTKQWVDQSPHYPAGLCCCAFAACSRARIMAIGARAHKAGCCMVHGWSSFGVACTFWRRQALAGINALAVSVMRPPASWPRLGGVGCSSRLTMAAPATPALSAINPPGVLADVAATLSIELDLGTSQEWSQPSYWRSLLCFVLCVSLPCHRLCQREVCSEVTLALLCPVFTNMALWVPCSVYQLQRLCSFQGFGLDPQRLRALWGWLPLLRLGSAQGCVR